MSGIFRNFQFLINFIEFNKFQICNLSIVTLYIILRYEVRTHIIRLAFIVIRKKELLHRPLKIPELDFLCCMKPRIPQQCPCKYVDWGQRVCSYSKIVPVFLQLWESCCMAHVRVNTRLNTCIHKYNGFQHCSFFQN